MSSLQFLKARNHSCWSCFGCCFSFQFWVFRVCVCCKSKSARHAPLLHITRKNDTGFFSFSVLWTTLGLFSAVDVSFIGFFHVSKGYARTTFQLHLMMSNTRWSKCKNRIFSLQWMIPHSWTNDPSQKNLFNSWLIDWSPYHSSLFLLKWVIPIKKILLKWSILNHLLNYPFSSSLKHFLITIQLLILGLYHLAWRNHLYSSPSFQLHFVEKPVPKHLEILGRITG